MAEPTSTPIVAAPASQPQVAQQPVTEVKKKVVKRRTAVRSSKISFVKSKRKRAIARASARPGKGSLTVNGFDINTIEPDEFKALMMEPINFSSATRAIAAKMDLKVNVQGGGASGQAQAVRSAIAKSIIGFSGMESLKKDYMHYDRFMVVDDSRRVEPKKFKGPKARARFQKSYR